MTPFLKQIAQHYHAMGDDLSSKIFVFPSQRAVIFFQKYLSEVVKETSSRPVIAPAAMSIDKFFASLSSLVKADRISLLVDLYGCYQKQCEQHGLVYDSLDDFVFWGDVILSDFGDVDKYLVDAKDIFRNISQWKALQDDFEGISDTQRKALESFFGNFRSMGEFKDRFVKIWDILSPLYDDFGTLLESKGQAYEGKLYRHLLDDVRRIGPEAVLSSAYPDADKVVFCGLNALSRCETKILEAFKNVGLAEFCWDYESEWIRDKHNKSTVFMERNIVNFPSAFKLEPCVQTPQFEVISVPSSVGQVKLLSELLRNPDVPKNENTAVVLPDEGLLLPLLDSIPAEISDVNVTMGFPMTSSSFFSLMDDICRLPFATRTTSDGDLQFYHKVVWSIAGNNIFTALSDPDTKEKIAQTKRELHYYIPQQALCGTPLLDCIFKVKNDFPAYLCGVLDFFGGMISGNDSLKEQFSLELDLAMEYYKCVTLLADKHLPIELRTFIRLLRKLVQSQSVPFKGEPLQGLQIMGPLEARALDFDTLFILSCNEAVFPRHNVSSSFIPPALREGFELPTYVYQDAVWAYYFYRMVQRPRKVVMILDSRTEGLKSGEESRYIKQLKYAFKNVNLTESIAGAPPAPVNEPTEILKTAEHILKMKSKSLSASSIKNYLTCPVKFYYSFIENLKEEEEVSENLDSTSMGTVFHEVIEDIYRQFLDNCGGIVRKSELEAILADGEALKTLIRNKVGAHLKGNEITGRDIVSVAMIYKYVVAALKSDVAKIDPSSGSFRILHLEKPGFSTRVKGWNIYGVIDRIDSFADGTARVVDYKTGSVIEDDENINDATAETIVEKIFTPSGEQRPMIALQFFIYNMLLSEDTASPVKGLLVFDSVYSMRKLLTGPPVDVPLNRKFYDLMYGRLLKLLDELANPDISFRRTDNLKACELCVFKTLCAR